MNFHNLGLIVVKFKHIGAYTDSIRQNIKIPSCSKFGILMGDPDSKRLMEKILVVLGEVLIVLWSNALAMRFVLDSILSFEIPL